MNTRAKRYLIFVALGAVACFAVLYWADPTVPNARIGTVIVLCSLALVAESLAVVLPNTVLGSISFIPYLAAALIVPNWIALAGLLIVRTIIEITSRRETLKAVFNIGSQGITFGVAVLAYLVFGGSSMANFATRPLVETTLANGIPAVAAFVLSFATNSTLISGILAANSNRPFADVWRGTHLSTIGVDVLASPIVFLFAWVYVGWGPVAAVALWIPLLGLRQLHKANLDLERNNSELLELMVKSMEARDPYTSGHSRRVQQYSVAIARALNLAPSEVDKVSRAALLHDVGKIYERYAPILRKPGRLTPEEWQTMQQHPSDGAELVSTMSRLHDIVPSIRHHHERWDGTGYPDGLAGEMIPQMSRIIAFADTIDAMTSERPYRRTLSETEVRSEIIRCRGTQFDPAMTDKILSAQTWRHLFTPIVADSPAAKASLSLVSSRDSLAKRA